ncbi:MAG: biotin/lipoyl-binding protein [Caldilineae bacterium]|nr:MAG: biotin/lipoyl-binding protein [Caldilineae bacterium]
MKYHAQVEDQTYEIEIEDTGTVRLGDRCFQTDLLQVGPLGLYSLLIDHASYELIVEEIQFGYRVTLEGRSYEVKVADERQLRLAGGETVQLAPGGELAIRAPIPGLVVRVLVEEGQEVEMNQPVVILEAMKMENELRTPRAGVVSQIKVAAGESVEQGAELILLS